MVIVDEIVVLVVVGGGSVVDVVVVGAIVVMVVVVGSVVVVVTAGGSVAIVVFLGGTVVVGEVVAVGVEVGRGVIAAVEEIIGVGVVIASVIVVTLVDVSEAARAFIVVEFVLMLSFVPFIAVTVVEIDIEAVVTVVFVSIAVFGVFTEEVADNCSEVGCADPIVEVAGIEVSLLTVAAVAELAARIVEAVVS